MEIEFFNVEVDLPQFNHILVKEWFEEIIKHNKKKVGEINVIFCNDAYILKTNKQYLGHNYFTDIITFNYSSPSIISGDLFISLDTVKSNSHIFNTQHQNELFRVMVHGVLHLLGWDDKNDEEASEMRRLEDFWLKKFF